MFSQNETYLGVKGDPRNHAPFAIAAIAVALIFLGWVRYAREQHVVVFEAAQPASIQRNADAVAFYGSGQLKILSFYADPAEVKRGSRALVCYGVSNADSVRIDPSIGEAWPSTSRCLEVIASKDTDYKLTVRDTNGREESRTVSLRVSR